MNLWDIKKGAWSERLLKLAAGSEDVKDLKQKLGSVPEDGGGSFGTISPYFVERFGFTPDCAIIPFTGDNPSTILALPLRESDAMVSLGTSTTFLMSTPHYLPDPAYHFMNHPTTAGLYMFMLCYKNGGLAREHVRNEINANKSNQSWAEFDSRALSTSELAQSSPSSLMRMGIFFPRREIVPNIRHGQWRYSYDPKTETLQELSAEPHESDARVIIESQMLSLRLRSAKLVRNEHKLPNGTMLPPQPRRVYLVGGGSANAAIARICGEVLGGVEGVYRLDIGGNACALGAAYKAVWGCERKGKQTFEELIGERWNEEDFVERVADGYKAGVFERYGEALKGFHAMEQEILKHSEADDNLNSGGVVMRDEHGRGAHNP